MNHLSLPEQGRAPDEVLQDLADFRDGDPD